MVLPRERKDRQVLQNGRRKRLSDRRLDQTARRRKAGETGVILDNHLRLMFELLNVFLNLLESRVYFEEPEGVHLHGMERLVEGVGEGA